MRNIFIQSIILSISLFPVATDAASPCIPLTYHVDPFIGTQGLGNTFPGASRPYGLVKLGPDCGDCNSNMGYRHDGDVMGFSHLHVSGTGGGCKYGNIRVSPFFGDIPPDYIGLARVSEEARPGYYSTVLADGDITAEMTVTPHTGIHRYSYTSTRPFSLSLDLGKVLGMENGAGEEQIILGSEINVISDTEIIGQQRVAGGWNIGKPFTIYFYAVADCPFDSFGTWSGNDSAKDVRWRHDSGSPTGAWITFRPDHNNSPRQDAISEVGLRVGVSFISPGKARENCLSETAGKDFDTLMAEANRAWENELAKIDVTSSDADQLRQFYTAIYHTMLQPVDKTGENALWVSDQPYYDDFYCLWDTFRTSHPLLVLIDPKRSSDIVKSLIDMYRHEGYMPDGRSGDSTGRTQGGSNADMLVAEAILKNLPGIDPSAALEAMQKDAEVAPGGHQRNEVRGGLDDFKSLGYVSTDYERAGTRTMEYCANDWAIALAARKLGLDSLYLRYAQRASNWENLWRDVEYDGFSGFIMPRKSNGEWDTDYTDPTWDFYCATPQNALYITPLKDTPRHLVRKEPFSPSTPGSWCNFFYETDSWEYSLYVPQDMATLIEKCGGAERFTQRLDAYFDQGRFHIDNEPGFLTPYLYIYAGNHGKTEERIREVLSGHYSSAPDGLPGNDDSGAMSSLYIFHRLGFFPLAGTDIYLIGTPSFEKGVIDLDNGKKLTIFAQKISPKNRYVNEVTVNGRKWDKAWFNHADIENGAEIIFKMGPKPGKWAVGQLPPSIRDYAPAQ